MEQSDTIEAQAEKALRFCKLTSLRSEAYVRGDAWVRQQLADLKIDRWLITEHSSDASPQLTEIDHAIDVLQSTLHRTIFDPKPEDAGELSLQSAAADTAQYALWIIRRHAKTASFEDLIAQAKSFLTTQDAVTVAHDCMEKYLDRPGVIFDDAAEVLLRANRMLSHLQ